MRVMPANSCKMVVGVATIAQRVGHRIPSRCTGTYAAVASTFSASIARGVVGWAIRRIDKILRDSQWAYSQLLTLGTCCVWDQ